MTPPPPAKNPDGIDVMMLLLMTIDVRVGLPAKGVPDVSLRADNIKSNIKPITIVIALLAISLQASKCQIILVDLLSAIDIPLTTMKCQP